MRCKDDGIFVVSMYIIITDKNDVSITQAVNGSVITSIGSVERNATQGHRGAVGHGDVTIATTTEVPRDNISVLGGEKQLVFTISGCDIIKDDKPVHIEVHRIHIVLCQGLAVMERV